MTPTTIKALEVLRDHGPLRPAEFAHCLWPEDHPGWRRVGKCGYGSSRGVGMRLSAGGYLGKLRKMGFAHSGGWEVGYSITEKGREALAAGLS